MGVSGHPFLVKKVSLIASIKKHKGKVTHIAKEFDVSTTTLRAKINEDPELVAALADARRDYMDLLCDNAEDTLGYALSKRDEDLSNSLKSSFYILNNLGRERGYSPLGEAQKPVDEGFAQKFAGLMGTLHNMQKERKAQSEVKSDLSIEDNNNINDT